MLSSVIPTVDLSTIFLDGEEEGKKRVSEIIKQACTDYGLFQVVNHDVPIGLLTLAMELCKEFFDLPYEEKLKFSTKLNDSCDLSYEEQLKIANKSNAPLPLPFGYSKHPLGKNEFLFMLPPGNTCNVLPSNPPNLRFVIEKLFTKFAETCEFFDRILNDSLGLPQNFLKDYNSNRCLDNLVILRYYSATESENNGVSPHQDPGLSTIILQDDIGGLEILKDGEWIPVVPIDGALIFHISDMLQVLTNNKLKSPLHRVVRHKEKSRYSFVFFNSLSDEKWVEPLPEFTKEIGEPPKYRGFTYKDYFYARAQHKLHPPARAEDKTNITSFASVTGHST